MRKVEYYGKPIESYSKKELIEIICEQNKSYQKRLEEQAHSYEFIASLKRPTLWQRLRQNHPERRSRGRK